MNQAARSAKDLVIANRILAHEGLVDAFGEVSVRHPLDKNRFLLACGRSPGAVVADDLVEFTFDGVPAAGTRRGDDFRSDGRYFSGRIRGASGDRSRIKRAAPRLGILGSRRRLR